MLLYEGSTYDGSGTLSIHCHKPGEYTYDFTWRKPDQPNTLFMYRRVETVEHIANKSTEAQRVYLHNMQVTACEAYYNVVQPGVA